MGPLLRGASPGLRRPILVGLAMGAALLALPAVPTAQPNQPTYYPIASEPAASPRTERRRYRRSPRRIRYDRRRGAAMWRKIATAGLPPPPLVRLIFSPELPSHLVPVRLEAAEVFAGRMLPPEPEPETGESWEPDPLSLTKAVRTITYRKDLDPRPDDLPWIVGLATLGCSIYLILQLWRTDSWLLARKNSKRS